MNYYALSIIISPKPNPVNKEVLKFFKVGRTYKAFYETDENDQGWFIPPNGRDFQALFWLTPPDGKNRSDFREQKYIMDNFFIVKAANYNISEDGTVGFNLL